MTSRRNDPMTRVNAALLVERFAPSTWWRTGPDNPRDDYDLDRARRRRVLRDALANPRRPAVVA